MSILITASMTPGSAVARQTLALVESLARTDQVEVWVPADQQVVDLPVPHHTLDPDDADCIARARGFAQVIHVISGDSKCTDVAALARNVPGVVILHDISLLLSLNEQVMLRRGRPEHLIELVRMLHGPAVAAQLELNFVYPGTGIEAPALHQAANALPYFLHAATAIVTHSQWAAERIAQVVAVPVLVAALPAEEYAGPGPNPPATGAPVVVPGIVNLHKLVATAVEGYARSGLADAGHPLVVLGRCDERMAAHLRLTARREGVEDHLLLMAPAGDDDFLHVLSRALAVVTLRQFNTEAQSAALLAGILSGRPVVASDAGGASDLPDDIIMKVPDQGATPAVADAVARALRQIADDPDEAEAMAERAVAWVHAHHTLPGYVTVVRDALRMHMQRVQLVDAAMQMADRLVATGLAGNDHALRACADALASLGS